MPLLSRDAVIVAPVLISPVFKGQSWGITAGFSPAHVTPSKVTRGTSRPGGSSPRACILVTRSLSAARQRTLELHGTVTRKVTSVVPPFRRALSLYVDA